MKDPYEVLGVQKSATDDEIKAAYRALAKKYHPDNYAENPLSDLAEEKMREINDAYDNIMNERRGGQKASSANGGAQYGAYNGGYSARSEFSDIRNLISSGRIEDAQTLLDGVPPEKRNGEWYFLNGTVLYRRGWFEDAYTSFTTACRLNPENPEYRAALNQIQKQRFGGGYRTMGDGASCTACDICSGLLCADCLCRCFGGGC